MYLERSVKIKKLPSKVPVTKYMYLKHDTKIMYVAHKLKAWSEVGESWVVGDSRQKLTIKLYSVGM